MKINGELTFTSILFFVICIFIYCAWDYNPKARLVPLVVALPALALTGIQLALLIRDVKREDRTLRKETTIKEENKRLLVIWLFLTGFIALVLVWGFLPAIFVFLFSFLRFFAKKTWLSSTIITVTVCAAIYFLFKIILIRL